MDLYYTDCYLFSLDVLDVSKQCFSLHVGGCVTHVSDVSGMEEHFIWECIGILDSCLNVHVHYARPSAQSQPQLKEGGICLSLHNRRHHSLLIHLHFFYFV